MTDKLFIIIFSLTTPSDKIKIDWNPRLDKIFRYDATEQQEIRSAKPWDRDPNYFKYCKISAAALIKMAIHAHSGGNIEVKFLCSRTKFVMCWSCP